MTPARRVRRAPLSERLAAHLNPWDFLLWLAEELNGNEWQDRFAKWAYPAGVAFNVLFLICRGNDTSSSATADDIFSDYDSRQGTGWFNWVVSLQTKYSPVCKKD